MIRRQYLLLTIIILLVSACTSPGERPAADILNSDSDQIIPLKGEWQVVLERDMILGEKPELPGIPFAEVLELPGTLAENNKGTANTDRTVWRNLSREYMFEGTAYYKRIIQIPESWKNKRIIFRMERTRKTAVWLDGRLLGTNPFTCTPQVYELGEIMPGEHELIVAVDNVVAGHPAGRSHMNEEATQTNWNGIVGKIQLEATPEVWISKVRIFPQVINNTASLEFTLCKKTDGVQSGSVTVHTRSFNTEKVHIPEVLHFQFRIEEDSKKIDTVLELGPEMLLWDEFDPALYRSDITLELENGEIQKLGRTFGMREFTRNGSQFVINGNTTFLRGKNDACVFPLTGYAPMDVPEWVRVLNIAREYDINHYRFHTWCPPEAALAAADLAGIYIQPELPSWGELDAQERGVSFNDINAVAFGSEQTAKGNEYDPGFQTAAEKFLHKQAEEILDEYGNYASFVMLAIGNELKGNRTVMQRLVDGFREYDGNRRLYSQGSNNNFRDPARGETDDYFTTVRTSTKTWKNYDNNTRISFSRADQYDGGTVNALKPTTRRNFSKALEETDVPVIGHETGQYSYYPDYNEIEKYTGVTRPWNLELGQILLKDKGMYDLWPEFFSAAGRWASILYCEDMEAGIRTPGFGGFQLLDLQDFPGQGTALVGPLNAFMESKGNITPDKWREFCSPVTLLAEFNGYTLSAGEEFIADIKVANYSKKGLKGTITWSVDGVGNGEFSVDAVKGGITEAGKVKVELPELMQALQTRIELEFNGTGIVKSYPLWIYPAPGKTKIPENVLVSDKLDNPTREVLENGGRVLLIPEHEDIKQNSVGALFMTEFWSYRMFYQIAVNRGVVPSAGTLGLLIDENHPALRGFPGEFHSNWQWFLPVKNSRPVILDDAPEGYRPFVQTIDNMWRSHKLGTLFEFNVGKGKILVSAIDLPAIENSAEGNALYKSLLDYVGADIFNPTVSISFDILHEILYGGVE